MRTIVVAALILAGCKKAGPEPAAEPPKEQKVELTAEMPDTPEAKAFAASLLELEVTGLNPTGTSDFEFERMTFAPDGTWTADARLDVGVETAPCKEVGTWSIEGMDGQAATMVWTVTKSTCANRSTGDETRVEMSILADGSYKAAFR